ncbi:HDIG domain-containing protein [Bacteroidales bacterium]|nr:HDIG domain-containing protein [Bacteroidales bacterium]
MLTAPFDFPIHKSAQELAQEQDIALKNFSPYFLLDSLVHLQEEENLELHSAELLSQEWTLPHVDYMRQSLSFIYSKGLVSLNDKIFLQDNRYDEYMILENKIAYPYLSSDLFTQATAYAHIINNCPENLDVGIFNSDNLGHYLKENLRYDTITSEWVKNNLLQDISKNRGLVQTGQKIIDKGEIIDTETFLILNSLKEASILRKGSVDSQLGLFMGAFILIIIILSLYVLYLYSFANDIFKSNKDALFLFFQIGFFTILTAICVDNQLFNVYVIPFAIIPISIRVFFNSSIAQMTHATAILICALMLGDSTDFIFLQLTTAMVAVFSLKDLSNRFQFVRCSILIFLCYVLVYIGLCLLREGNLAKIDWSMFVYFGINFIFLMFTYAFIYIIEKIFRYTSSVTLMELSDINSPLLREFSETCPGTFQHSLQVSVLASTAAIKIGINPLLIRTGALFHDIGKIKNPAYFAENKISDMQAHQDLTYEESAKIIIQHVALGVELAEKHQLPRQIIDFIRTHHGKGITKYFYNSYRNENPELAIDISKFSYPGPNPFSKETAIVMMADSVEASSRSLKEYTEASITALVNKIIDTQIKEGLLRDSPLTFKDIEVIKSVFIEKLINIFHSRISYPDLIN